MPIRNRVLTGAISLALVAVLAACGATTATTSAITGTALTIYSSLPLQGSQSSQAADVLDAERLALQQAGAKVGRFTINFVSLNDATGTGWSPKLIAANARTVIQRANAVAYIGEIDPGASAQSVPITNANQVLQVSPYDTTIGLTQATVADSGSPDKYYQSLTTNGRNFGRVVPSDTQQAKAQLQLMKDIGVKKLFIADDGGAYGDAIALAVEANAGTYGISANAPVRASIGLPQRIAASGEDAVFYGGVASAAAAQLFNAAAAADPHLKLFGPGGLYTNDFTGRLAPAAQRVTYLSEPSVLPPVDRAFVTAFKAAYHRTPWTQAIFGYAAMQAVLGALQRSKSPASRAANLSAFFTTKSASSALGTYSIDKAGDISLASYIFARVKGGKPIAFKGLTVP